MKIIESVKPLDTVQVGIDEICRLVEAELQTTHGLSIASCVSSDIYSVDPLGSLPSLVGSLTFSIKPESE